MFNTINEILDWLKESPKHVIHDHDGKTYIWIEKYKKVAVFWDNNDAFTAKACDDYITVLKSWKEEDFLKEFTKDSLHVGHQSYIVKLPDGSFKYDLEKYNTFEDAIIGEWKSELPLTRERLEDLMKVCYPYKTYKPKRWQEFVDCFYKMATKPAEPCVCRKLEEKIKNEDLNWEHKAVEVLDVGFNTALTIEASEDPRVHGHIFYSIGASGEDSAYSGIQYCPFCGRKL